MLYSSLPPIFIEWILCLSVPWCVYSTVDLAPFLCTGIGFCFFAFSCLWTNKTLNLLENLQQLSCIVETVTHLLKMTTTVYLCWQKHFDLPLEEQLTLVTRWGNLYHCTIWPGRDVSQLLSSRVDRGVCSSWSLSESSTTATVLLIFGFTVS